MRDAGQTVSSCRNQCKLDDLPGVFYHFDLSILRSVSLVFLKVVSRDLALMNLSECAIILNLVEIKKRFLEVSSRFIVSFVALFVHKNCQLQYHGLAKLFRISHDAAHFLYKSILRFRFKPRTTNPRNNCVKQK